jgi:hypothetical protein
MGFGVERGRRVRLTDALSSMSRLFRHFGILNISQPYRPPRSLAGIAFTVVFGIFCDLLTLGV